jgi:hypothetical protein
MILGFFTPETSREAMAKGIREAVDLLLKTVQGEAEDFLSYPDSLARLLGQFLTMNMARLARSQDNRPNPRLFRSLVLAHIPDLTKRSHPLRIKQKCTLILKGYHSFGMDDKVSGHMQELTLPSPSGQGEDICQQFRDVPTIHILIM